MIQQPHTYQRKNILSGENSNSKLNFEPFLLDRRCCFKNFFISTDLASSDSMIMPIKLSIPKKPKQNNINYNNLNPEQREANEKANQIENTTTNNNSNKTNEKEIVNSTDFDSQNIDAGTKKENSNIDKNDDKILNEENVPKIVEKVYKNANLDNKIVHISKENLFEQIQIGSVCLFHMKINKKNPVSVVSVENPTEEICQIVKESKKRSLIYKILTNGDAIASVTSSSHDSFYTTAKIGKEECEISAQIIQKQSKEYKIRLFQAFFPKKGQMIAFNSFSSVLLQNELDRIQMEPRLPKMKKGIPVMYFGGRVKKESVQNFILETRSDSCAHFVFGKVDDTTYIGEVYSPLSPIQAISIAISHFK